jgi:hypothetical protein
MLLDRRAIPLSNLGSGSSKARIGERPFLFFLFFLSSSVKENMLYIILNMKKNVKNKIARATAFYFQFLELPYGTLDKSTFCKVINRLDPVQIHYYSGLTG